MENKKAEFIYTKVHRPVITLDQLNATGKLIFDTAAGKVARFWGMIYLCFIALYLVAHYFLTKKLIEIAKQEYEIAQAQLNQNAIDGDDMDGELRGP